MLHYNACITFVLFAMIKLFIYTSLSTLGPFLIRKLNLDMNATILRYTLFYSNYLSYCKISSSLSEIIDLNYIHLAAKYFKTNICIHIQTTHNTKLFFHFTIDKTYELIHLHLNLMNYIPFISVNYFCFREH